MLKCRSLILWQAAVTTQSHIHPLLLALLAAAWSPCVVCVVCVCPEVECIQLDRHSESQATGLNSHTAVSS